jgi:tetratricopeptide (TPR) repeat protein
MNSAKALITVILISFSFLVSGQDINAVGNLFNQGIDNYKAGNYEAAIGDFQQTISSADALGADGEDLKFKAQQQLALSYYNYGKSLYKSKKYSAAINEFELAATAAEKAGDSKTMNASNTYIAGLHTAIGNSNLKKDQYDKAIEKYNLALDYKNDYIKAYYGKALVYKKKEEYMKMKEAVDKALSMASADEKTAGKARSAAATTFLNAGAIKLQRALNEEAADYLKMSTEYDNSDPLAYYYMAVAYNGMSKWESAIEAGNTAIEKGYSEPADVWFEMGKAYAGKGNTSEACEAFSKVTAGANVEAAKYQKTEVLGCN